MRRQDIQLLASARQGDIEARYEVGRRYLLGVEGFPLHTDTGLGYLTHTSLGPSERAARTIADALPLHELVRRNLLPALVKTARAGSTAAQLKLGAWRALTSADPAEPMRWLDAAAAAGDAGAVRSSTCAAKPPVQRGRRRAGRVESSARDRSRSPGAASLGSRGSVQ